MRVRSLLIAIFLSALVALVSMSQLREVKRAGFEWTPGIITMFVLLLAIAGNRVAWAFAFVVAGVGVTLGWLIALTRLSEPAHLAIAATGTVVLIALWGLRPDDEPAPAPRDQG